MPPRHNNTASPNITAIFARAKDKKLRLLEEQLVSEGYNVREQREIKGHLSLEHLPIMMLDGVSSNFSSTAAKNED